MRRRTAATVVAGLALAATGATAPMVANAATPTVDDVIVTIDATTGQVMQVQDEVFGTIVVVPGSHHERALTIKNAGPSAATLTVAIVNATAVGHTGDAAADPFHGDLLVNGIPASTHAGTETVIDTVHLDRNASTDVVFDVQLPRDNADANAAEIGAREFAFDVRLSVAGDPEPTPTPSPTVTPAPGKPQAGTGPVTHTGGTLAGTSPWLLAGAAALAAIAAIAGRPLVVARRRNDNQPTS